MQNCEIALGQMGYMSDLNSIQTMEKVVEVLSLDAKLRWARLADETLSNGRQVNFSDLCQFVSSEARVASSRYGMLASTSSSNLTTDRPRFPKVSHVNQMSRNDSCALCHYKHQLEDCERFISLSIPKRWNVVRRKHICYACLEQGHVASNCTARRQCRKANCSERHHELLHMENIDSPQRACHAAVDNTDGVCLGVIPVRLTGPNESVSTYALLDTGSDVSLVEKNLTERIGLVCTRTTLNLSTINRSRRVSSERVEIEINSVDDGGSSVTGLCHCITSLSIAPEVKDLNAIASQWPHLENLSFVNIPDKRVRLLIGTDIPEAHWPLDRKLGRLKQPFAVRTPLGWTLLGPLSADRGLWGSLNLVKDNDEISKGIQLLYDTEFNDVALPERAQSYNESVASKLMKDSTVMKCGHFEIGIPWKSREPMPNNFCVAYRRLMGLRRKFMTDKTLYAKYSEVMLNNVKKGYVGRVPVDKLGAKTTPRWYLPHHPVINPKKPGKVRVVMDCAAKYQGMSLNDRILKCPDTTTNLVGVLLRLRLRPVAVCADIEEMFMQVRIPECDRNAFRFLWWESDQLDESPVEYQMLVHPFVATSSPFCANHALKMTADSSIGNCTQQVKQSIERDFYVDDCLALLPDIPTAVSFVTELTEVLRKGGFRLRKWLSNEPRVLQGLDDSELAPSVLRMGTNDDMYERTLGLDWNARTDKFQFRFHMNELPPTRRMLLSTVSSLFDPLGLVAPFLLPAKCLLQRLCKRHVNWDEELPDEYKKEWSNWTNGMQRLATLQIPRCIRPSYIAANNIELHVFSDASEFGYGVVACVRWCIDDNNFESHMLYSKSRVSPIKFVTLPRLELNAARLAARVAVDIESQCDINFTATTLWTDSMIVLHYIRNVDAQYTTFVPNRVCQEATAA